MFSVYDEVWYLDYEKVGHRAVVVDRSNGRYELNILTVDGRVVPAVGVTLESLRPFSCPLYPKVL